MHDENKNQRQRAITAEKKLKEARALLKIKTRRLKGLEESR